MGKAGYVTLLATVMATAMFGACVADSPSADDGGSDASSSDVANDISSSDAASEAAATDASDAATNCNPTGTWNSPTVVVSNAGAADTVAPRLLPNELTMFFASSGRDSGLGDYDLYSATRATIGDAFANITHLNVVNSTFADDGPTVTTNGLTLYFTSNRASGRQIYVATRSTTVSDFSTPALVTVLDSAGEQFGPYLRADGQEIFFSSTRTGAGGQDIYRSEFVGADFQTPVAESALNTAGDDGAPTLSADGLRMYFASDRTDGGAQGGTDIWQASRPDLASPFGTPTNVTELNTSATEFPGWISPDDCRLYFTSNRPSGGGDSLYVATRSP